LCSFSCYLSASLLSLLSLTHINHTRAHTHTHTHTHTQPEQPPGQAPLAEASVRALLRALQPMRGQIPGDVGQLLKKVQAQVARLFPTLTVLVSVSVALF